MPVLADVKVLPEHLLEDTPTAGGRLAFRLDRESEDQHLPPRLRGGDRRGHRTADVVVEARAADDGELVELPEVDRPATTIFPWGRKYVPSQYRDVLTVYVQRSSACPIALGVIRVLNRSSRTMSMSPADSPRLAVVHARVHHLTARDPDRSRSGETRRDARCRRRNNRSTEAR
jgi:hypothetical protein